MTQSATGQRTPQRIAPPHVPIREDWLALRQEEAIEPDIPIIDAHHHLWDRSGQRYLFDDFLRDAGGGHDIRASVHVQCRSMYRVEGDPLLHSVGETEFVNGVAARSASGIYGEMRACAAIVGFADPMLGDALAPVLEAHIAAAPDRFRGVRATVAAHDSPGIAASFGRVPTGKMMDSAFRQGFALLSRYGLSYDAWAFFTQLGDVLDLAKSFPDTPIVVNHVGGVLGIGPYRGKQAEVFAEWRRSIQRLARCPNVSIKLGGLGMFNTGFDLDKQALPPGSLELAEIWRPYIETCVEAFGAERSMFESNFPVDKSSCSYTVLWNAFKHIVAGATRKEKELLFGGTAARIYRLENALHY